MLLRYKTFFLLLLLIPGFKTVTACSCFVYWKTIKEGAENVDFAATGKVVAIDSVLISNSWYRRAQFVITKKFKSSHNVSDTVNILTGGSGFDCNISFYFYYSNFLDLELLIFADIMKSNDRGKKQIVYPNTYYTWNCMRPRILYDRKERNLTDSL